MSPDPATPILRTEEDLTRLPASERIRYRLVGAQCRYHANDNIAEHIREVRRRTTMSYVGVFPTQMDAFAPVIPLLREE